MPASKTKVALLRINKDNSTHIYLPISIQIWNYNTLHQHTIFFDNLFLLKFSHRKMTSQMEQKKNTKKLKKKKISKIYRTWESLTSSRHHFHAEPILPTFIRIRCFVKYQFHPIIYIFPGRYASHFINSMESESVEFHRLQFRPSLFLSVPPDLSSNGGN